MKLKDSKTYTNLAKAFAGECQARTKYKFLEYACTEGGYKAIADLIKEIICQEFNHARMLYTFIQTATTDTITNIDIDTGYPFKQKWNLLENFKLGADDENNEATKIYPEYAKIATQEGFTDIAGLFNNLIQVETCHKTTLEQIYTQMKNGTMYKKPTKVKWKCSECGHEEELKEAWTECPLCQAKQGAVLLKLEDKS